MSDIKMSIITPCFNSGRTIAKTLESVETQGYGNMEHIIIDGGSTDDTLEIIRKYADRVSYDVRIVSEPDNGIYDAMNKGIHLASGDLIGIINSDDWYEKEALSKVSGAYTGADAEIIYGMIKLYDSDKLRSIEFYHHDFLLERMINHPGCFISSGAYAKVGDYNTAYRSSADYEWMKRACDIKAVFTPVYEVLADVRTGGMSSTNVGYRETLKLWYEWGKVSKMHYILYSLKSRIGDVIHRSKKA